MQAHSHSQSSVVGGHSLGHGQKTREMPYWAFVAVQRRLVWFIILFEIMIIVLYSQFVRYDEHTPDAAVEAEAKFFSHYAFFQDVHVMIFIGFGFLMTFISKYAWSAVGFTYLIACMAIQWAVLTRNFFSQVLVDRAWHYIHFNLENMITAEFAAGSFLISFGAVIGRVSFTQLIVMMFVHIIGYGLNEHISFRMNVVDPGGAMVLHAYGAYFGIACSLVLFSGANSRVPGSPSSSKVHALFSMIGTVFLFMFWPSFNAAIAAHPERAVINTYISLTGSVIASYLVSYLTRHDGMLKFDIEDVQNATLAGGVVMGAACEFLIQPWGALLIGAVTGALSTLGFVFLSPALHKAFGLYDTCGVNNLHGIPGICGGVASVIAAYLVGDKSPLLAKGRDSNDLALDQLSCLGISLACAVGFGVIAGLLMRIPICCEAPQHSLYDDCESWIVHDEATGFDKGGHSGENVSHDTELTPLPQSHRKVVLDPQYHDVPRRDMQTYVPSHNNTFGPPRARFSELQSSA